MCDKRFLELRVAFINPALLSWDDAVDDLVREDDLLHATKGNPTLIHGQCRVHIAIRSEWPQSSRLSGRPMLVEVWRRGRPCPDCPAQLPNASAIITPTMLATTTRHDIEES